MQIRGLDRHIEQGPRSCPHNCPFYAECDSENTGICLLDEYGEDQGAAIDDAQDRFEDAETRRNRQ